MKIKNPIIKLIIIVSKKILLTQIIKVIILLKIKKTQQILNNLKIIIKHQIQAIKIIPIKINKNQIFQPKKNLKINRKKSM